MKSLISALLLLAGLSASAAPADLQPARPNIIIMMADDLGYGDVSCNGATKIKTPNIDRLAREGIRFTDAHAPAAVCTPTRYGLLTGRYSWRTRLQKGTLGTSHPLLIATNRMTLASLLKGHGYKTAAIGKWHLGFGTAKEVDWNKPLAPGPLELGFDYYFGVPQNHNDNSRAFVENHDIVGRKPGEPFRIVPGKAFPEGLAEPRVEDQVDTTLTAKALDFIQENRDRPFFLYFTPCAPHTHVTPAAKFRGTSQAGIYGDYIQELDAHVGEILDRLDQLKLNEKTLVIFTSDNGGGASDFRGGGVPELKLASDAGGVREKFRTAKRDADAMGHRNNGALRGAKGDAYEGGHREPFVARWPGRIPAGSESAETICLTDLLATTASILGVKLPDNAGEDSYNILTVLTGKTAGTPIRPATVLHGGNGIFSIRSGPWKLVKSDGSERNANVKTRHDELYNLAEDLAEAKDLAAEHPDRVKAMNTLLEKFITEGRSTPGSPQKNNVEVRRYPSDEVKEKKPAK
jgi:arylsulfatase A